MLRKNENVIARHIHGPWFLIDITDNYAGDRCALYEINETGHFIWSRIDGRATVEQIARQLQTAITEDVAFDVILADSREFTDTLRAKGFLTEG